MSYYSAELYVNGARAYIPGWNSEDGGYSTLTNTFLIYLNSGDYAQLGKEFSVAATVEGGDFRPAFSGYLLG